MNTIHAKAATLRQMIADRGLWVGELSTSTNREGGHSAYFEVESGSRIRVSDHDCNDHFRIAEFNWWGDADDATVDAYVADTRAHQTRMAILNAERHAQHAAEQAARKAAYDAEQAKAAANTALLDAAGLAHLVGNARKKALKALREA